MGEIRLSVPRMVRRGGRLYWQPTRAVKALGFAPEALGTQLTIATRRAIELNDLVAAARAGRTVEPVQARTIGALIRSYRQSPPYLNRSASSRATYDLYLRRIDAAASSHSVVSIKRAALVRIYQQILEAKSVYTANAHMAVWANLCRHAIDIGWRTDDPMHKFRLLDAPARTRLWSRGEIDRLCGLAVERKRPSVALAVRLGYDTAQRLGDVLRLPWAAWDGEAVAIRQRKTGAQVRVPVSTEVAAMIEAAPRRSPLILTSELSGRPYSASVFGKAFVELRDMAGLERSLQFRDLRRTKATELGQAGATHDEIVAVTGHKSREMVSVYVLPTSETAARAQRKWRDFERERNGKVGKPQGNV